MKSSWLLAAIAIVAFPMAAQTTGRIAGKVTDSAGKPIANATVTLRRTDTTVMRTVKVDSSGGFSQIGLEPYDFELVVTAEGYVEHKEKFRPPVGDTLVKNITLKKPEEASPVESQAGSGADVATSNAGSEAYNRGINYLNEKNYIGAMKELEIAMASFKASTEGDVSEDVRSGIAKNIVLAAGKYALCQYEIGKADPEKRKELWTLAEPALQADFESNHESYIAQALASIANMRGDKKAEAKYLDEIEKKEGPQAEISYNRAVDLFNEGKYSDAKTHLKRAIEIDPKLSETYYLLAICEYSDGDMKAAKSLLEKYLQMDPKGKYAATVKEMLADPSFK